MSDFVQQNLGHDVVLVLHDTQTKIFHAFDGMPFFTIDPEDKRKDLKKRYEKMSDAIADLYSYVTHSSIEKYLLANDYLQSYVGDAVTFMANLFWLKREYDQLFRILVEDFPTIDKNYKLLGSVVNIDYYYHEISRYAHDGASEKAFQLYKVLKGIRNYSGLYVFKKDLQTLDDLKELWYFDE